MKQLYVIDTSVILKALLDEEDSDKATKLFYLKEIFELSIFVPDIFRYEFFNRLTRENDASFALKAYREFTEIQVSIITLEADIIEIANKLMWKYHKISFYDAAYHALAKAYRTDLITADEKYYQITRKEGNVELLKNLKI